MQESRSSRLPRLFLSLFSLACFTFGGGFVILSLMKKKFVEELGWLSEDEMLDITAIAQSSPGPIMVNASVIVGYRICGIAGALVATAAASLPPLIIITVIAGFYTQFRENRYIAIALKVMRAGVAAVILDVAWGLALKIFSTKNALYISMMVLGFGITFFLGFKSMSLILICLGIGIVQAVYALLAARKGGSSHAA